MVSSTFRRPKGMFAATRKSRVLVHGSRLALRGTIWPRCSRSPLSLAM